MRGFDLKYKIIGGIITVGVIFSILFFSIRDNWNFSFIIKDILYFPVTVMNFDKEYVVHLEGREKELQQEVTDLKGLLGLKNTLTEYTMVNATVINRNSAYWNEELVINKGSKDKIKEGMAVINQDGLVGRVQKTGLTTSVIKLITSNSNDNKISIKIWRGDNSINKVLEQDDKGNLMISGIDNSFPIQEGDIITTSGLSDIYPSGITIGHIERIDHDKFGISKKAYIKHKGDFDNLRFVAVLIRGIE